MRRRAAWFALLALAASLALAFSACSFGHVDASAPHAPKTTTTAGGASPKGFVRACDTSVFGTLDSPGWQAHSVIAGPLVFYYGDQFAKQPDSVFAPLRGRHGHYAGQKLLVLVRRGAVVTVVVPESIRSDAALLYDPAAWNDRNAYRIEDGENAVTFRACKKGETAPAGGPLNAMTQFNGGVVVAGARCVPLEVHVQGEERSIAAALPFGSGRCT
jgi:hypothetical protein